MDLVVALIALLVPVAGVAAQAVRTRYSKSVERQRVESNIELYESLPDSSTMREDLLEHIDSSVRELLQDEGKLRTDPQGIVLAIAFIVGAALLALGAYRAESWQWLWVVGAVFTGLLGLTGLSTDVQRVERDERGRRIK